MLGMFEVASIVAIVEVPPMYNVAFVPWVNVPPTPERAVVAVMLPLLVKVVPVTVRAVAEVKVPLLVYAPVKVAVGIEMALVPLIVLDAPLKVCTPVPELNVPLSVKLPA